MGRGRSIELVVSQLHGGLSIRFDRVFSSIPARTTRVDHPLQTIRLTRIRTVDGLVKGPGHEEVGLPEREPLRRPGQGLQDGQPRLVVGVPHGGPHRVPGLEERLYVCVGGSVDR